MKKFIAFAMSLFIMTTMMTTDVFADTGTINTDGGTQNVNVSSNETVTNNVSTDTDVFRVTVDWTTTGATYNRTDTYTWDATQLKYVLKDGGTGTASTTPATATITLTNYSNLAVDYDISFESAKTGTGDNAKDIASEAKASDSTGEKSGTLASADTQQAISGTAGTTDSATYKGTISYLTANYLPKDNSNTTMGTYTVTISTSLTLSKSSVSLKAGKTETITANKTGVTWSTSDSNVATVTDGTITAIAAGTATITATYGTKTANCTVTVTAKSTAYQFGADAAALDTIWNDTWKNTLLNSSTVDFSYNSVNYTAYNGFIGETAYANFNQAQYFVANLNDELIAPAGKANGTDGTWILLDSANMCYAWATATKSAIGDTSSGNAFANYQTVFEGVYCLWSSKSSGYNYYYFRGLQGYGDFASGSATNSSAGYGFVVIWAPSN